MLWQADSGLYDGVLADHGPTRLGRCLVLVLRGDSRGAHDHGVGRWGSLKQKPDRTARVLRVSCPARLLVASL